MGFGEEKWSQGGLSLENVETIMHDFGPWFDRQLSDILRQKQATSLLNATNKFITDCADQYAHMDAGIIRETGESLSVPLLERAGPISRERLVGVLKALAPYVPQILEKEFNDMCRALNMRIYNMRYHGPGTR